MAEMQTIKQNGQIEMRNENILVVGRGSLWNYWTGNQPETRKMTHIEPGPPPCREYVFFFSEHPEMLSNVDYSGCKEILSDLKE